MALIGSDCVTLMAWRGVNDVGLTYWTSQALQEKADDARFKKCYSIGYAGISCFLLNHNLNVKCPPVLYHQSRNNSPSFSSSVLVEDSREQRLLTKSGNRAAVGIPAVPI
eukprot:scaffold643529_cov17-Prasinocladus_malaysianus.AAC.1